MNNELIPFVPGDKNRPLNFWPSISITFFWNVAKFQSMVVTDMESCVQSWNIIDFVYFAAKKKIPKNFYGKYLIGADRFEVLVKTLNSQFSHLPILKNLLYYYQTYYSTSLLQHYRQTYDRLTTTLHWRTTTLTTGFCRKQTQSDNADNNAGLLTRPNPS